jgi:signal transduction histidine kinase
MVSGFSELLRAKRERMVGRFVERLYDGAAANSLAAHEVADSAREFIDELADAIERHAVAADERADTATTAAKQHGRQRFQLGYDMATVVREYDVLGDVLFEEIVQAGLMPSLEEVRILSGHLVRAVADSAEQYGRERDELVKSQAARHLSFLAHELRNPLSSMGIAFSLLKGAGLLPDPHPSVGVLDRGLSSLKQLIDDALVNVSLEHGQGLALAPVDVATLVGDVMDEAAPQAAQKRVQLVIDCEAPACTGDVRYIHSALSNLVRNAVKFSKAGGTVRVAARGAEGRVVFEVEDECGGIPQEQAEKLFDPFVQRGEDRTGFGLGLAIAKQATDAHGGSLRVHTLPGRGCVFVMDLPEAGPVPV